VEKLSVKNPIDGNLIDRLLSAADEPEPVLADVIANCGPGIVADVALMEAASRMRLVDGPPEKVPVRFDVGFDGNWSGYEVVMGAGTAEVHPVPPVRARVVIRQQLTDLLRELFGTPGKNGATREVTVQEPDDVLDLLPGTAGNRDMRSATLAAYQALQALSRRPRNLTELAVRFCSDKWGEHWYTPRYEQHLRPYRDQRVRLLEIGVGGYHIPNLGGASLRMWKHYFCRGLIYGVDLFDKSGVDELRLRTIQGDQADPAFLDRLGREIGPLDIIIDDGSHLNRHVLISFGALFPHLRPGGLYIIEDTQTSYWPGWGGSSTPSDADGTSMGMVKQLIDGLNHQEQVREPGHDPSPTEKNVMAVHAYHNLVVIEKGVNAEQSAPHWMPRTDDAMTWFSSMSATVPADGGDRQGCD
jgi:demethylmacrocin O-methyltransferase